MGILKTTKMNFNIEYNNQHLKLQNITPDISVIKLAAEFEFSLNSDAYTLTCKDSNNLPIFIDDQDDLEFSLVELSNSKHYNGSVNLHFQTKTQITTKIYLASRRWLSLMS